MLLLHGGLGVPGDGLAGFDRTTELAVFVGGAEAVLGEFVPEVRGLGEELKGVPFVTEEGIRRGSAFIEKRLETRQPV